MKLAMLYILIFPLLILGFARLVGGRALRRLVAEQRRPARARPRSSTPTRAAPGNNGSAFAGLNANTPWWNTTLGLRCSPAAS